MCKFRIGDVVTPKYNTKWYDCVTRKELSGPIFGEVYTVVAVGRDKHYWYITLAEFQHYDEWIETAFEKVVSVGVLEKELEEIFAYEEDNVCE